jgi:hypothetical protein
VEVGEQQIDGLEAVAGRDEEPRFPRERRMVADARADSPPVVSEDTPSA